MAENKNQEIMILLKKKQNHIEQIFNYTMDMEKSASQNDSDTIDMLLDMRYHLMMEVEAFDEQTDKIIQYLSAFDRIRVKAQMSENPLSSDISFEEGKINEIYNSTKTLLVKIIESDRKLSLKLEALSKLSAIESV